MNATKEVNVQYRELTKMLDVDLVDPSSGNVVFCIELIIF